MIRFNFLLVLILTQLSLSNIYGEKIRGVRVKNSSSLKYEDIIKERGIYNDLKGSGGLHGNTNVMTQDGKKRVCDLSLNDRIKVFNRYTKTVQFAEIIRIFVVDSTTGWDVGSAGNPLIIGGQQGFLDVKQGEGRPNTPARRVGRTYHTYDSLFKIEKIEKKKGRFDFYDIEVEGSYDILLPDHNNLITHRYGQIALPLKDYKRQRRNNICEEIAVTVACLPCLVLYAFAHA